jgi:hypothetical protein
MKTMHKVGKIPYQWSIIFKPKVFIFFKPLKIVPLKRKEMRG